MLGQSGAVLMLRLGGIERDDVQVYVPHAALGGQRLGQFVNRGAAILAVRHESIDAIMFPRNGMN